MRVAPASLACLVLLLVPATAAAAQRYAAPEANGPEPCAQAAPCSLTEAIAKAQANDEVIVAAGSYAVGSKLSPPPGITGVFIHGDFAGPMPRIEAGLSMEPPIAQGPAGRLSYLEIVNEADQARGADCPDGGGAIERVRLLVVGSSSKGIFARPPCTVRDVLVEARGQNSMALEGNGSTGHLSILARNVTAIAEGPESIGIQSFYYGGLTEESLTIDLKNSIASGDRYDLYAAAVIGEAKIKVSHSNYDVSFTGPSATITDAGGNQNAPPLFVNAAGGDYREAAGSPTIDAGVADQLGALDLGGSARVIGPAPDIGAFEFMPPGPDAAPILAPAAAGRISSLAVLPSRFRAANVGGAILSAKRAPVGTTVSYVLSAAATVRFSVERKLQGRKVGKRCVKKAKANEGKKKCALFKPVRGGFDHAGTAGANRFRFSGRLARSLAPGAYRLTGKASASSRTADFRVVR